MTDKQIIIDGVDVSGCEWIREVGLDSEYICTCNSPNKTSGYCKYNPNCCYKGFKRKEQECEELKNIIDEAKNSKLDLKSFLVGEAVQNEYEEQLDQLKEQLEAYKMEADEGKEINAELKAENDELKKCYKNNSSLLDFEEANTTKLVNKVMKLEKTLTEIKEIAENAYCLTNATNKDMAQFAKQILQKISEVEDA